jgi:hypothetical protein
LARRLVENVDIDCAKQALDLYPTLLEVALNLFRQSQADFADWLIIG